MKTPNHLTDDQFTDCVLMESTAEAQSHLAECEDCRQELARFTESMQNFSTATLAWSEAQPSASLRAAARSSARRPMYAAAGWALATGLVLSVGVPFVWHRDHPAPTGTEPVVQAAAEDTEAQIAEDNQMMQSVNLAIRVHEPSPFTEYRLHEVRQNAARPRPGVRSE
jgi:hypothetical protein